MLSSRIALLLGLLACAVFPLRAQDSCSPPDITHATSVCDGRTYDFSVIRNEDRTTIFKATGLDGYNYFFEMFPRSLPKSQPGCPFGGITTGNALGQGDSNGTTCFSLGQLSTETWQLYKGNPQVIEVWFQNGDEGRSANVRVICNSSTLGALHPLGETSPGSLTYILELQSCAACPGSFPCGYPPPCKALSDPSIWPGARGGMQRRGQSPVNILKTCSIYSQLYVWHADTSMVVTEDNIGFIANAVPHGILLINDGNPAGTISLSEKSRVISPLLLDGAGLVYGVINDGNITTIVGYSTDYRTLQYSVRLPGVTGNVTSAQLLILGVGTNYICASVGVSVYCTQGGKSPRRVVVDGSNINAMACDGKQTLFFGTDNGVASYDAPSGRQKWNYSAPGATSVIVGPSTLFVPYSRGLLSLNLTQGALVWSLSGAGQCLGEPVLTASCALICMQSCGSKPAVVAAINATLGTSLWTVPLPRGQTGYSIAADQYDGIVYTSGDHDGLTVTMANSTDGTTTWQTTLVAGPQKVADISFDLDGRTVVVASSEDPSYFSTLFYLGDGPTPCPESL